MIISIIKSNCKMFEIYYVSMVFFLKKSLMESTYRSDDKLDTVFNKGVAPV